MLKQTNLSNYTRPSVILQGWGRQTEHAGFWFQTDLSLKSEMSSFEERNFIFANQFKTKTHHLSFTEGQIPGRKCGPFSWVAVVSSKIKCGSLFRENSQMMRLSSELSILDLIWCFVVSWSNSVVASRSSLFPRWEQNNGNCLWSELLTVEFE